MWGSLPQAERGRYAEELEADLRAQPGWGRLAYTVSTVIGMPRLRWELLCKHAGQAVPFCFVGMHRNLTVHPNSDEPWIIAHECVLCRRVHDPRQFSGPKNPKNLSWIAANQR